MESSVVMVIVLQIAGVVVVIAELILPSGGLLSVLAVGLFGYSIYAVFAQVSTAAGVIVVAIDAVLIPILVIVGLKLVAISPVTLRKKLSRKEGVTAQDLDLEGLLGLEGTAVTNLRPSGIALIQGERVDVVSRGDYVEKGSEILVSEVTGNQIIVRKREV
jgi:membrane-bound serine protease (ClpP class)